MVVYKALLLIDVLWISYIKWYKYYNKILPAILGSKQEGSSNSRAPNTRSKRQFSCWFSQSYNENKQKKIRKCLQCVKVFSCRFNLTNGKKQTENEKQTFLKDCIEEFFNFSHKNIHDKIIHLDATLLVPKKTMRTILNNYGLIFISVCILPITSLDIFRLG